MPTGDFRMIYEACCHKGSEYWWPPLNVPPGTGTDSAGTTAAPNTGPKAWPPHPGPGVREIAEMQAASMQRPRCECHECTQARWQMSRGNEALKL